MEVDGFAKRGGGRNGCFVGVLQVVRPVGNDGLAGTLAVTGTAWTGTAENVEVGMGEGGSGSAIVPSPGRVEEFMAGA